MLLSMHLTSLVQGAMNNEYSPSNFSFYAYQTWLSSVKYVAFIIADQTCEDT